CARGADVAARTRGRAAVARAEGEGRIGGFARARPARERRIERVERSREEAAHEQVELVAAAQVRRRERRDTAVRAVAERGPGRPVPDRNVRRGRATGGGEDA